MREALQLTGEALGPRNPDTLNSMVQFSGFAPASGCYGEAWEALDRETLRLSREVLGPRHPDTLTSMSNLAGALEEEGHYGEAEPLLCEALDGREVLGPHPMTLVTSST